jgi:hypothetical protein
MSDFRLNISVYAVSGFYYSFVTYTVQASKWSWMRVYIPHIYGKIKSVDLEVITNV